MSGIMGTLGFKPPAVPAPSPASSSTDPNAPSASPATPPPAGGIFANLSDNPLFTGVHPPPLPPAPS